jgi:hypothetical protein
VELVWLTLIGLIFVALGISVQCGWWKAWYIARVYPPFSYRAAVYFYFPFSLFWFSFPIGALLPMPKEDKITVLMIGMGSSLALCLILAIWQPRWLKPLCANMSDTTLLDNLG